MLDIILMEHKAIQILGKYLFYPTIASKTGSWFCDSCIACYADLECHHNTRCTSRAQKLMFGVLYDGHLVEGCIREQCKFGYERVMLSFGKPDVIPLYGTITKITFNHDKMEYKVTLPSGHIYLTDGTDLVRDDGGVWSRICSSNPIPVVW